MRDPTFEERKSVADYIRSISKDTGINFYDYTTTHTTSTPTVITINYEEQAKKMAFPSQCAHCSNNPANGGSGICFCTVGLTPITC